MLDRNRHEIVLRQLLDKIYGNRILSGILGFKGGTACYFFYDLPRFSTDLDFNLMTEVKSEEVLEELITVLEKFGNLKEKIVKKNTIFLLLQHTEGQTGIKVEISTRKSELINEYEIQDFYGKSLPLMKKDYLFANKLVALTQRRVATARDLFDINYFFNENWDISEVPIRELLDKSVVEYLSELAAFIEKAFSNETIHHGLGQLLNSKEQVNDVRENLKRDVITKIKIYLDSMS